MADELTREQAELVLKKNQQNIIQKAADGKVLSPSEKASLEDAAGVSVDEEPRTVQELANALGIARRTVFHLRKTANAPKTNSLEDWSVFLEERSTSTQQGLDSKLPQEIAETKHRLLKAQAGKEEAIRKLREYELQAKEDDLVPMGDAKEAVRRILAPLRHLLDGLPKAVAPHANPRDVGMAERAIEEGLDKIFQMMQEHAPNDG